MKKLFVIISCVFFINATLDSENIELEIERLGENSVRITWLIKITLKEQDIFCQV